MQIRKHYIGHTGQCDFGEGLHSACSKPYYYESAYNFEHSPNVLMVDSCRRCSVDDEMHDESIDKV